MQESDLGEQRPNIRFSNESGRRTQRILGLSITQPKF